MALSVRQAIRQQPMEIAKGLENSVVAGSWRARRLQDARGPLYIATPYATRLDEVATATFRGAPDDLARLGFAVAHALDPRAPSPGEFPLAGEIARALKAAKKPLVIAGASCASEAVIQAAANVAMAGNAALSLPPRNAIPWARHSSVDARSAPHCRRSGMEADTVIVLENDLYRRAPAAEVDAFPRTAAHVIVLDHLDNPTTRKADLVLPAGTFAESDGTFVSSEGRAQRFFQVFVPQNDVSASWRWLKPDHWHDLDDVLAAMSRALPELAAVKRTPRLRPHFASPELRFLARRIVRAGVPPCW
jgi:NADH-quinone oxidoreductase subunit G